MPAYEGHTVTASFPDKHAMFPLNTAVDGDIHYVGELGKVLKYDGLFECWHEANELLEVPEFMASSGGTCTDGYSYCHTWVYYIAWRCCYYRGDKDHGQPEACG